MTSIKLAHAMASDFTVTWQFSQREYFFVTDQTPCPYGRLFLSHFFKICVLIKLTPGLPPSWTSYLRNLFDLPGVNIVIDDDELLIISSFEYIKKLGKLLESTEPRVLANYLGWRAAKAGEAKATAGTNVMVFKIFSTRKIGVKILNFESKYCFLDRIKAYNIGLRGKRQYFCRKWAKIADYM
jgi:hypothetical protein